MATKIRDVSQLAKYQRPTKLINATDLIEQPQDVSEITRQIREINDVFKREYEQEEEKLNEGRRVITERLSGIFDKLQNGVNAGSVLHAEAQTRILELMIDLHGLKKPVNKKPETKTDVNIKLVMGKPRKDSN